MNKRFKKNMLLVFLTVVSDLAATSFILPLLPFYAGNSNAAVYAILFASYPAAQFIGFIPMGCLSDKFGRKRMILITLFGSILGAILQMLAPSLGYLILFRFIAGCFGTTIVTCQAYITDCVKKEEKSKYLSRTIGCATLSFSIGPFISSIMYGIASWIPFLMCAVSYVFIFIIDLLFLDDSPKFDERNQSINTYIIIIIIFILLFLYIGSSMRLLFDHEDETVISTEETIAGRVPRGSSGNLDIYLPKISRQQSFKSDADMNEYLTNISIVYLFIFIF